MTRLIWSAVGLGMILLVAGCGSDTSPAPLPTPTPTPAPNSFAPAASLPAMNQARASATATLLPNGKVLIAGGTNSSGALASVDVYDPATNSFAPATSLPTMNSPRFGATATLLPNGKVLIAGGQNSTGSLASVELYDPATNSFASAASLLTMNTARDGAAAVELPNSEVLIAGGEKNGTSLSSVELYNSATNSFVPAASTPTMSDLRAFPTATLLPNGKVLIAGGLEAVTISILFVSKSVDLYDPATNSFAPAAALPSMNAQRFSASAALLPNGDVLISGGVESSHPGIFMATLSSVDLYNPAGNTFTPAASLPAMNQAREGATSTLLNNGKVLIAGGAGTPTSDILASVDLYDAAANTFASAASTPTMNNRRINATATLLPNGEVLIAGGQGAFGPTNTVELYIP